MKITDDDRKCATEQATFVEEAFRLREVENWKEYFEGKKQVYQPAQSQAHNLDG